MNNTLSFILGIIVGAAAGAVAALLMAPKSGEELRAQIQKEVSAESQRIQARYDQGKEDLKHRVDQAYSDLRTSQEQGGETGEQAAEGIA